MPVRRKSNSNFVADEPKQGWAYFEETGQWRRTPAPWGAPKDHFPKEYGDWFAVTKPAGWQPPAGTLAGESLLDGGAASLNAAGGGSGGGTTSGPVSGTKTGAGHKPQPYGWHGYYGETGGSSRSTPGTDNEAWRLKEKQFSPEKLVKNARADVGSDKWAPKEINGKTYNQCNIFVADKLHETGAPVPNVGGTAGTLGAENGDMLNAYTGGRIGGQPPSANDWHKGKVPGYEEVTGAPKPGDIASDSKHVAIVSEEGKTVSVTSVGKERGHVVENDWGFRDHQKDEVVFRRYSGPARNRQ